MELHPWEIWEMELWEYNAYMHGFEQRNKQHTVNSVLTGYYSAYYANSGKKAQPPNEVVRNLYRPKQNFTQGISEIEKVKEYERRRKL